jgi:predicted nucleotidyltransferase/DNA-binding XRE family transcriptional regulator
MRELQHVIRDARLEAGLTQAELAVRAETSQPAIARYEQGRVAPTLPTLQRLLAACGRRAVISTIPIDDAGSSPIGEPGPDMRLLLARRDPLLAAADQCGARDVRVFGSVSRGEQRPDSDIDLLVELEPGRTLLDLARFRRQAGEILGAPVDVATPDMLKERVRAGVLTQAKPL